MTVTEASYKLVNVSDIEPSPFNARDQNEEPVTSEKFIELCDSIKLERGLIEPIVVRRADKNGKYEAVAGTRRLKALRHIGVTQTSVIIREMTDNDVRIASLVENIHRRDITEEGKEKTLKDIYVAAWDEWKPDDWDQIMPREKDAQTDNVEIYDCRGDKGKLILAKQYLNRLHNQATKVRLSPKKAQPEGQNKPIIFPTEPFIKLRERIGYAVSTQLNLIRGYGSGSKKDHWQELDPITRAQLEEDERLRKLDEEKKRQLAKQVKKEHDRRKKQAKKTKAQATKDIADKFFKAEEQKRNKQQQQKEPRKRSEPGPVVQRPEVVTNPVRARQQIIALCEKLFKVITTVDFDGPEEAERQMNLLQTKQSINEILTYYVRERELANLQQIVIPTNKLLGRFRDAIYESIEIGKKKDDIIRP